MKQHIIVHGTVQGVGFRHFVQTEAEKHGVNGWVRNKSDGTVEVKAESDEQTMGGFLDSVAGGNNFSKVDHLDIEATDSVEHNGYFSVKY
ncbi:acylphosphatase [Alteribacillus sp. HJP-4]|uniref:acylphosphatase n=1 Tax=Alteribacillus sp. HJP-4 TaxID=2775394 RepID=UPI0035CCECE6